MSKMYIVTRADLPAGAQAAQSSHAAVAFVLEHPELARHWNEESNNLVLLQAADEAHLVRLFELAYEGGVPCSRFREPDFDNAHTAIALHGDEAGRLVSSLPLLLRAPRAA